MGDLVARGRSPHQRWWQQWSADDETAVQDVLVATRVADLADRLVDELSGGQRQRVWLAIALAQDTDILLLDEPTTYLNLAHQVDVLELVAELNTAAARTIVMVLHDLNHAARYGSHLIAMKDGASSRPGARLRLEKQPSRVVCGTDRGELCSLLALGVKPVGFGQRNDPLRPWVRSLADGIDSYDLSGGETSFDRLAAFAPDALLVQTGFATPETLPRYTEMAPTIATSFLDWRENLGQVAETVGLADGAKEVEAEVDQAVADAAAQLPARAKGLKLQAITAFSDGSVYILNDSSPVGKIAAAMGLVRRRRPRPRARRSTRSASSS